MNTLCGELSILSCGRGDMRLSFTKGDRDGLERVREIIEDMMKRGYMLFVEMKDGTLRQAQRFDARTFAWVLKPAGKASKVKREVERAPVRRRKAYGVAPTSGG